MKKHIVFSTGAGISAPSGLGTYRGPEGLWTLHPELEAASTGKHYARHREEMEPFWNGFRDKCEAAKPNAAHRAIAQLQRDLAKEGGKVTVITQNVDRLHHEALTDTNGLDMETEFLPMWDRILPLHGDIFMNRCLSAAQGWGCESKSAWLYSIPPGDKCDECDGPTRPDVVFFGEKLPEIEWGKAQSACLTATHYIAVGTSGEVVPACDLVSVAKQAGAKTILINAEPWKDPHPDFDETLLGDCTILLPQVIEGILGELDGS